MPGQIEFVQKELKKKNLYNGAMDGVLNPDMKAALDRLPMDYNDINQDWPHIRKAYAFLQIVCLEAGFDPYGIDGLWGVNTENAYNSYLLFLQTNKPPDTWRPEDIPDVNPNNWPKQYTPEFDAFFGPKGSNHVRLSLPYPLKLSWDTGTTINSLYCHAKVHDSMKRVLNKVLDHYGLDEIERLRLDVCAGCYNDRPIRGGTKPSMHSWAVAVDFDPDNNSLEWGRDRASFARPEYNKWWECWEEEGWVSLGRQRNFDWMHVQAAKI
jgi:hypothetical protein